MKINYTSRKRKTKWFFSTVSLLVILHSSFAQNNAIFKGGNADGFSISCVGSAQAEVPLPVSLVSFTSICNNKNVTFYWSTASETNNDYFLIQSTTDLVNWVTIQKINGAGNSTSLLNYSFSYSKETNAIYYYRLKQVDFNGDYKYSAIINDGNCKPIENEIVLFPNPSSGIFNLQINNTTGKVLSIDIYNVLGEKMYHSENPPPSYFDFSDYNSGNYLLVISFENKTIKTMMAIKK